MHLLIISGNLQFLRTRHHLGTSGCRCNRTRLCTCIVEPYPSSEGCERLRDQLLHLHFQSSTNYTPSTCSMREVVQVERQRFRLLLLLVLSPQDLLEELTLPEVAP